MTSDLVETLARFCRDQIGPKNCVFVLLRSVEYDTFLISWKVAHLLCFFTKSPSFYSFSASFCWALLHFVGMDRAKNWSSVSCWVFSLRLTYIHVLPRSDVLVTKGMGQILWNMPDLDLFESLCSVICARLFQP